MGEVFQVVSSETMAYVVSVPVIFIVLLIGRFLIRAAVNRRVRSIHFTGMDFTDLASMKEGATVSEEEYKLIRQSLTRRIIEEKKEKEEVDKAPAILAQIEINPDAARSLIEPSSELARKSLASLGKRVTDAEAEKINARFEKGVPAAPVVADSGSDILAGGPDASITAELQAALRAQGSGGAETAGRAEAAEYAAEWPDPLAVSPPEEPPPADTHASKPTAAESAPKQTPAPKSVAPHQPETPSIGKPNADAPPSPRVTQSNANSVAPQRVQEKPRPTAGAAIPRPAAAPKATPQPPRAKPPAHPPRSASVPAARPTEQSKISPKPAPAAPRKPRAPTSKRDLDLMLSKGLIQRDEYDRLVKFLGVGE